MDAKTRQFDAPDAAMLRIGIRYNSRQAILIAYRAGIQLDTNLFSASRKLYIESNKVLRLGGCNTQRMRLY